MGQQQLLLIILVTILVGIATITAVMVFGTTAEQMNRDAVRQDLLDGAHAAQRIWSRPLVFGGADRDFEQHFSEEELLQKLIMPVDENGENEHGVYSVEALEPAGFILRGEPAGGGSAITATVQRDGDTGQWQVELDEEDGEEE